MYFWITLWLHAVSEASTGDSLEHVRATAQMLLLICKQEKLARVLSNSKESLKTILTTFEVRFTHLSPPWQLRMQIVVNGFLSSSLFISHKNWRILVARSLASYIDFPPLIPSL